MSKDNVVLLDNPVGKMDGDREEQDSLLRKGARKMLEIALEAEVAEYISRHCREVDEKGHRQVVRNGRSKSRGVQTGLGKIEVKAPRVNDKRPGKKFESSILPPYLRKSKSIEGLVSWLYLKGVSTSNMSDALVDLVGPNAAGFSPNTVCRLTKDWAEEYKKWSDRDLSKKEIRIHVG